MGVPLQETPRSVGGINKTTNRMTKTVRLPTKYSNLKLTYAIFPVTKTVSLNYYLY